MTNGLPFEGIFPIVPTVFDERGDFDEAGQCATVDFLLRAGVQQEINRRNLSPLVELPAIVEDRRYNRENTFKRQAVCHYASTLLLRAILTPREGFTGGRADRHSAALPFPSELTPWCEFGWAQTEDPRRVHAALPRPKHVSSRDAASAVRRDTSRTQNSPKNHLDSYC